MNKRLIVNKRFDEKLIINKNYNPYTRVPKSWRELRQIIVYTYDELGAGTEQKPIDFNDIDISNIDSFYNVNMNIGIFVRTDFEYIDISKWDVSNVKDMTYMFFNCWKLKSVGDLSNWNVSKVEDMSYMFRKCYNLKSVGDLSNWNISNLKDMSNMFEGSAITNIPDWYE